MCRADLIFEVDFGVNGAIGTIMTKWDLILFGKWIIFIHNTINFKIRIICLQTLSHGLPPVEIMYKAGY